MNCIDPTSSRSRRLGRELLLWLFATFVGTSFALFGTHVVGQYMGFGHFELFIATSAVAVMSLTWGAWAALLWTSRGPLRRAIVLATQIPSLWMFVIAAILYWFGLLRLPIMAMLIGGGLALVFVSRRLTRTLRKLDIETSVGNPFILSILHSMLVVFTVSGFLYLWVGEVVPEIHCSSMIVYLIELPTYLLSRFPDLAKFATDWTLRSILAVSLISTVIPAIMSEWISRMLSKKSE